MDDDWGTPIHGNPHVKKKTTTWIWFFLEQKKEKQVSEYFINLVGGFNPSEKYEVVSWDDEIPNIWKNKYDVPNHQPEMDFPSKKLLCFEWSPPWHFKTACWHHFCLKLLSRDFCPTNYPNHLFHLAGHCACQSVKQDINMSVGHVK